MTTGGTGCMTEARKAQLDKVAEHFHCETNGIYLLAGEVPGVIEYVPEPGELKSPRRERRGPVAGTKKPKGHTSATVRLRGIDPSLITFDEFDLI